jgi:CRISPR system Cascade subunit CasA
MHNLLTDPIITVTARDGLTGVTLPELLALLAKDAVSDFPALRPHQAPAWHAFLVQLAFLATEQCEVPKDAAGWAAALRALTPAWPGDEPWCLVARAEAPAFLQSAVPGGDLGPYAGDIATPDELDTLVTSKNHDLKAARMRDARAEDWLFALMNLQTTQGYSGRIAALKIAYYGVMRMNRGYGSRPFLGVMPAGGRPGQRFRRDLEVLRRRRETLYAKAQGFAANQDRAVKLLWLEPWDGARSLSIAQLHPLVIEICRCVRLEAAADGGVRARGTGSKAPRIAETAMENWTGVTGDPWAPIETGGKDGAKVLSITGDGFGWRRMKNLLVPGHGEERVFDLPLLARPEPEDGDAVEILAAALARGQGKTEGFHTRRVPVANRAAIRALAEAGEERRRLTKLAQDLAAAAMAAANQCLRSALFMLFQKGPDKPQHDRPSTKAQVTPWLQRFDQRVDRAFFDALWPGVASDEAQIAAGRDWIAHLHQAAREVFEQAAEAAPSTDQRRIFAAQRARDLLRNKLNKHLPLPAAVDEPETEHAG